MIKTLTKRITAVAVVTALVIMMLPLMSPAYAGSTQSGGSGQGSASTQSGIQTGNTHFGNDTSEDKTSADRTVTSDNRSSAYEGTLPMPAVRKVVMKKTSAKVTLAGKTNGCSYQYQVRKTGSSGWKNRTSSKTTLTLKRLKRKSSYEIRVRAYRKANGIALCSEWTTVKVKTTKKGSKTFRFN